MSKLKTFITSASVAIAFVVAAPVALAQDVVVFDAARVFVESKAGKDLQTKVNNIEKSMQAELAPEGEAIKTEKASLDAKSNGKTREQIQADTALVAQGKSYLRKVQTYQAKTQKRARELAATERTALGIFAQKLRASVETVRARKNAKIVLDVSNVYAAVDDVNITTEVIQQLDADAPTITVQKITLPDQPAGQ